MGETQNTSRRAPAPAPKRAASKPKPAHGSRAARRSNERAAAELAGRPVRTCVACRQPGVRAEDLLRLVAGPDGALAVDVRARSGGRGAWVHPTRACITTAVQRHAPERTLKVPASAMDPKGLIEGVRAALRRRADSLVLTASRTGAIAIGARATTEALERRRVPLVLVASDAAETTRMVASEADEASGLRVRQLGTKDELGRLFGRDEVALLAVTDARIAAELVLTLDRFAGLEG